MSIMHRIYLAGPIDGLTYADAVDWRDYVRDSMPANIIAYSPMRGKAGIVDSPDDTIGKWYNSILSQPGSIMARDSNDVRKADLVAVNLLGAKKASIGTCMELAWAWDRQIPVVCAMELGNLHEHPMLNGAISVRVDDLEEMILVIQSILLP